MKVTLVEDSSGEWMGIYIDGKLVKQGHSITPWEVLNLLWEEDVIDFDSIDFDTDDRYPVNLKDLKK